MAALRKKTQRTKDLPTFEVDVDDDDALRAVATALLGAILTAKTGGKTKKTAAKKAKTGRAKRKTAAKKRVRT